MAGIIELNFIIHENTLNDHKDKEKGHFSRSRMNNYPCKHVMIRVEKGARNEEKIQKKPRPLRCSAGAWEKTLSRIHSDRYPSFQRPIKIIGNDAIVRATSRNIAKRSSIKWNHALIC